MTAILDTSVFIAGEQGRELARPLPEEVSVSVVTLAELELGPTEQIFAEPRHPYTRALLETLNELPGPDEEQAATAPPSVSGCRYASRCPHRIDRCAETPPPLEPGTDGHAVACYRWRELAARAA